MASEGDIQRAVDKSLSKYQDPAALANGRSVLNVNVSAIIADDVNVAQIGGSPLALGQTTMAASVPVTIASNQTALPVTLPTGAHVFTSSAVTSSAASPISAGAKSISFVTSADFIGTINGASYPASASKNPTAELGKTLPAVAYTVTAGTLYIDILT